MDLGEDAFFVIKLNGIWNSLNPDQTNPPDIHSLRLNELASGTFCGSH